jgi:formate dehydrogenase iron-sulfur subunit
LARVAGTAYGFLTDATLCIGCKACEVACKQWNQLPGDAPGDVLAMTGFSYDNTVDLGATTWRHVAFVERPSPAGVAWLMLSDVCKHCVHAGCLDACPTGAIMRTEFDTVVIQDNICNGCGYCVPACPFGVPQIDDHDVATLRAGGLDEARFYGDDELGGTGGIVGLNAMFVLNGPPEAFNLPARPRLPRRNILPTTAATLAAAVGLGLAAFASLRSRP